MNHPNALIIFAKYPDPDHTKTRLSPPLSRVDAANLYVSFLMDTLEMARRLSCVDLFLAYTPPQAENFFIDFAPEILRFPQTGNDLGERMHQAIEHILRSGFKRVVLIGSDLPHLQEDAILSGFDILQDGADVVLGPCEDGGYYLVGVTEPHPEIFNLPMSNPYVLARTRQRIDQLGLRLELLPENFDVDTYRDLLQLKNTLHLHEAIPAMHTRAWFTRNHLRHQSE